MNLYENFKLAVNGLRANKMRALLTMLGIIIGIASVIGILTIGKAMTATVNNSLATLGTNNIYGYVEAKNLSSDINDVASQRQPTTEDMVKDDMIARFEEVFANDIDGVSVSVSAGSDQIKDGHRYANVSYSGVNQDADGINNLKLLTGRFLSKRDVDGSRYTAVVSDRFVKNLYAGNNAAALGQEFSAEINNSVYTFTIVGVYKYEENTTLIAASPMLNGQSGKDVVTPVYIPISTAKFAMNAEDGYQFFIFKARSADQADAIADKASKWFNSTYYANNEYFHFTAMSMKSQLDQVNSMMSTLSLAIAVIGGISLLVGGIGVMNIMLVSVTERTREIGTRKALGATNSNIRFQFIVESVIICIIGGAIGILIGGGGGLLASIFLKTTTYPSLLSILVAFSFSMAIGVFFGYYPANKAAKLDPIEALRYE